jgi:prolyl 4-hydroxylase
VTSGEDSSAFDRACRLAGAAAAPAELSAARDAFAQSAAEGDVRGALVLAGLVAGGIGGARDWRGALDMLRQWASRHKLAADQLALIDAMDLTPDGQPREIPERVRLHADREIELFPGMLSAAECDFIMRMAVPRLQPAKVFTGRDQFDRRPAVRNNELASFNPLEAPPFLHAINARIAAATGSDVRQGEPLQIMRYAPGQQFRPHTDGVGGGANKRVMTAILYLNDGYDGGETRFTELDLDVRGKPGDMLLFRNLDGHGEVDGSMRHAGLPVTRGVKFIATRWILQRQAYDGQGNLIGSSLWS